MSGTLRIHCSNSQVYPSRRTVEPGRIIDVDMSMCPVLAGFSKLVQVVDEVYE